MTAETARQFEALEAQATRIMGVFTRAGHEAVAPAIIQPAGVFLDGIGEALRARTYVFTDQEGRELCLRPDLTVPTCRLHLERVADPATPAKYCYNGAAFRYQPADVNAAAHPREFRQAGIESIGCPDPIEAEAETLATMIAALEAASLARQALHLRFGDLALMRALLDAVDMPQRWRHRLQAQFWRPQAFRAELKRLTQDPAGLMKALPPRLVQELRAAAPGTGDAIVSAHLDAQNKETFGARSVREVTESILSVIEDSRSPPLAPSAKALIEAYVAINVPCQQAAPAVAALAKSANIDLAAPLAKFNARLDRFTAHGLDLNAATFSGEFGRSLEYYTGFVFEIGAPGQPLLSPVAGGGRYDGLMRLAGSPHDVPAVGAAIHTERLLAAIEARAK
ncbi:MAG: ATP phosphoribosyltransferase regulatory subunit [Hyphomicrobiaceae bacterium]